MTSGKEKEWVITNRYRTPELCVCVVYMLSMTSWVFFFFATSTDRSSSWDKLPLSNNIRLSPRLVNFAKSMPDWFATTITAH